MPSIASDSTGGVLLPKEPASAESDNHATLEDRANLVTLRHASSTSTGGVQPTDGTRNHLSNMQLTEEMLARQQSSLNTNPKYQQERLAECVRRGLKRKTKLDPAIGHLSSVDLANREAMANWGCALNAIIPTELRPRMKDANGKRWAHDWGYDKRRLPPKSWTRMFSQAVARLSRHTKGQRELAHRMLSEQVTKRQSGP